MLQQIVWRRDESCLVFGLEAGRWERVSGCHPVLFVQMEVQVQAEITWGHDRVNISFQVPKVGGIFFAARSSRFSLAGQGCSAADDIPLGQPLLRAPRF